MKTLIKCIMAIPLLSCSTNQAPLLNFPPDHLVQEVETNQTSSKLEQARRSVFTIVLPQYRIAGSAVVTYRKAINKDIFEYQALTAHHILLKMIQNKFTHSSMLAMFQPTLHGMPLRMKLDILGIHKASPKYDWVVFKFHSKHRFEFVNLATRKEFGRLQAFERIYAVAGDDAFGQLCREGVFGAAHNEHINVQAQAKVGKFPWHRLPWAFFRPYLNAWHGSSGGAVLDKHGTLIGIIVGTNTTGANHMIVATKSYIIQESLND